jgi:8-oxo-dGTP pyrophosphatase MutT (NUDIX family)
VSEKDPHFFIERDVVEHAWHVFRLLRRELITSDNQRFVRTFLDSPGAVGTLAVDESDNVVLVHQYRATLDDMLWEIPAGMRDVAGEDPLITAQRELEEEAGLRAESWERLGSLTAAAGVTNSVVEIYLARGLVNVPLQPHGPEEEHMTVERVPFSEAVQMVEDGRITDAKSSIAILLAARTFPDLL